MQNAILHRTNAGKYGSNLLPVPCRSSLCTGRVAHHCRKSRGNYCFGHKDKMVLLQNFLKTCDDNSLRMIHSLFHRESRQTKGCQLIHIEYFYLYQVRISFPTPPAQLQEEVKQIAIEKFGFSCVYGFKMAGIAQLEKNHPGRIMINLWLLNLCASAGRNIG